MKEEELERLRTLCKEAAEYITECITHEKVDKERGAKMSYLLKRAYAMSEKEADETRV
jgi:hypothetical protein